MASKATKCDLRIIAIVGSPLQKAVFLRARGDRPEAVIVGTRGVSGTYNYEHSVLNDYRFLRDLEGLIGDDPVEIFLPNALTSLFYFCAAHPLVRRISFLDEGRLTQRFLNGGFSRPSAPLSRALIHAYRMTRTLPSGGRAPLYRVLSAAIQRAIGRTYERDTASYPYRTIERRWKAGVVLTHIQPPHCAPWIESVDLTQDLNLPLDYADGACLFVHPKDVSTPDKVHRLAALVTRDSANAKRRILRPHPLFSKFPERIALLREALMALGQSWETAVVSDHHETTMELYARGVRLFFIGNSSLGDTVSAHRQFFSELRVIEIQSAAAAL